MFAPFTESCITYRNSDINEKILYNKHSMSRVALDRALLLYDKKPRSKFHVGIHRHRISDHHICTCI